MRRTTCAAPCGRHPNQLGITSCSSNLCSQRCTSSLSSQLLYLNSQFCLMSKKESLASIRALRKDAIHLRLANANLSYKGSKEEMARRLHQHLSAQSTPISTGQRRSRSASQRTSSTIKKPSPYSHQPTPTPGCHKKKSAASQPAND